MDNYHVWFFNQFYGYMGSASYNLQLSKDDFIQYIIHSDISFSIRFVLICDAKSNPICTLHFIDGGVVRNDF